MLRPKKKKTRPGLKQRRFRQRLITYRESKGPRLPRKIPRAAVPSFFTLMNLFCGFLSLIQVLEGRFEYAGWLILLASFFDVLDGMMARLTNGTSLFGMELDSLCDVVSFGVAPSFLIYAFGLHEFGTPGIIIASLPAIAGAVRLARFNVNYEGEKKDTFAGLPIPVSAVAIVAIILNPDIISNLTSGRGDMSVILLAVVVLSGLMVSNVPFDSVPRPTMEYLRKRPLKFIIYFSGFLITVIFREIGLLTVISIYLVGSLVLACVNFLKAVRDTELLDIEQEDEATAHSEAL